MLEQPYIYLVDDDPDDTEILQEALRDLDAQVNTKVARNGREALDFLLSRKQEDVKPCLIVLDLNMPVLSGHGFIETFEKDPLLNSLPIIVFTTSNQQADIDFCKTHGIEHFVKPLSIIDLSHFAKKIASYCFSNIKD